ncbi:TetR family transcriptional regulator [Streptomyces sp. MNU77]|uniref:TetR/AcrR family transcriptional regulator n=1 Tax=Streptomyces sp. MNU77 TaxID=1573406 RepID=UPI0005E83252|nr:TetR/AcrR family transcriptional regulator [Streptomyces sp. MNU77]OLO25763.1 TetR family transcriptional regulator [Streptomyces sp. MNU77]
MTETFKRRTPSQWGEGGALKQEILAAAARLLIESGNEGDVSLRAVAREVGISAPSIYLHFQNRSELMAAVTRQIYRELVAELRRAGRRTESAGPGEALLAMAHRYCEFALENPRRYRLMFLLEHPTAPRDQLPGHPVRLMLDTWTEAVTACRDIPGPHPGDERSGDERDALFLWSALHGLVAISMALPFETDPRELAGRVRELVDRIMAE